MNLGVPFRKGFAPPGVLKKVEPLDSKTDDLLQVTDWLTGCVNHRLGPPAGERKQQLRRNSRDWICRTVNRITGSVIGEILSPGERTQVRASVTTISALSELRWMDSRKTKLD